MHMRHFLLACVVVAAALTLPHTHAKSSSTDTRIRTAVKKDAVQKFVNTGIMVVNNQLTDVSGQSKSGTSSLMSSFGEVSYDITKIKVTSVNIPGSDISFENNIIVTIKGVKGSTSFNWEFTQEDFPHYSDSGTGTADISDTTVVMHVHIGRNSDNEMTAHCSSCDVTVGKLDITLKGGEAWFYNLLIEMFTGDITDSVQDALSSNIQDGINEQATALLGGMSEARAVTPTVTLDMYMSRDPVLDAPFLYTQNFGYFYPTGTTMPSLPPKTVSTTLPSKYNSQDVQVMISDGCCNSGLQAYYDAGSFNYYVTDLPSSAPVQMNTDSFQMLIPALYHKYPNTPLVANMSANYAPSVTIQAMDPYFTMTSNFTIVVGAVTDYGIEQCFVLNSIFTTTAELALEEWDGQYYIQPTLDTVTSSMTLVSSNIGHVGAETLGSDVNAFMLFGEISRLNDDLSSGFPIPSLTGITMDDAAFDFFQGYFVMSFDLDVRKKELAKILSSQWDSSF